MKMKQILTAFILAFAIMSAPAFAGDKDNFKEVKIKTSAQCGMCKDRIEQAMAYEKGVKSAVLDLTTKELTVIYNVKKTSDAKIRLAISKIGYDADDVKADPEAYAKLPDCCKAKKQGGCRPGCGGH